MRLLLSNASLSFTHYLSRTKTYQCESERCQVPQRATPSQCDQLTDVISSPFDFLVDADSTCESLGENKQQLH
jgi:hypothetical protein